LITWVPVHGITVMFYTDYLSKTLGQFSTYLTWLIIHQLSLL